MSLIFRLAGNLEYNQCRLISYCSDADGHFGPFKHHAVVDMARRLREERGVSYDAVMGMAVHVKDAFSLEEKVPFDPRPETLDKRWSPDSARSFLAEARRFVVEADFERFISSHRNLYYFAASRVRGILETNDVTGWLESYFGARPEARFRVLIGLLNGPANYGARIRLAGGEEILYCILGTWAQDRAGRPLFGSMILPTVVHEFCHSYINPLVDAHKDLLEPYARPVFERVEEPMTRMAYGNWDIMTREYLVRASVIRFIAEHTGPRAAAVLAAQEKDRHFFGIEELADLLAAYEASRDDYPTLESFFPKILGFFEGLSKREVLKGSSTDGTRQLHLGADL